MSTTLVLDIETVPDPDLYVPPSSPGGTERPFPPLHVHKIVALGVLWLEEGTVFKRLGVIGESKEEKETLEDFAAFFTRHAPQLVSYNGRSFDLPVITLRAMRHGVSLRPYFQARDYRYRFTTEGHLDLADFLSEHGAAKMISLHGAARLIGLPGKVGVDGSQVEGLYRAGSLDAIRNYCLCDVAQTTFLFLRYQLLRGELDAPAYQRAAEALWDALAADARVGPILSNGVDLDRLLLRGAAAPREG
ncbi:MAG TPA: 3'-5' exonuclease [Myxococcota bacterium]|jgi:predicted PolB exonuclease-like 3'-5' exonuclease|nr:3'-5' exonuclease [Myxococcota bacterium]